MPKWTPWLEQLFLKCSATVFASVFDVVRSSTVAEEIVMTVFEEVAGVEERVDLEIGCRAVHRRALASACVDKRFLNYLRRQLSAHLAGKDRAYELADVVSYLSELVLMRRDLEQLEYPRQWLVTCGRNMSFDLKKAGLVLNAEAQSIEFDSDLPTNEDHPDDLQQRLERLRTIIRGVRDPKGRLLKIFAKAKKSAHTFESLIDCIANLLEKMTEETPVRADVLIRLFIGESVRDTSDALRTSPKTIENHRTVAYRNLEDSCTGRRPDASVSEFSQRGTRPFGDD